MFERDEDASGTRFKKGWNQVGDCSNKRWSVMRSVVKCHCRSNFLRVCEE